MTQDIFLLGHCVLASVLFNKSLAWPSASRFRFASRLRRDFLRRSRMEFALASSREPDRSACLLRPRSPVPEWREHGRATADQAQGTAATPVQEGERRLAIQRQRWASVQHQAGRLGLEGAISTQADRPYVPGDRGIRVMSKCLNRVEFIVVGWTDPEGSRSHAGWSVALRARPL